MPVVSAKLIQDLQSFTFVADTMDDLKTGLHPFIIADGSAEHRQANLEVARLYGLLSMGDHSVILSDLEALKAKETTSIPLTYFELECNLGMFGTLLGMVLGNAHALTLVLPTSPLPHLTPPNPDFAAGLSQANHALTG